MNTDPASGAPRIRPRCALALMTKVPVPSAVKTRLTPPLTPEEAATLSTCFLRDMTTNMLGMNSDGIQGIVLYTPAKAEAFLHDLLPDAFKLVAQHGETLGERLMNAATDLLGNGFASVCLINSDSPTLPCQILKMAVSLLDQEGDRVVLGPSQDGGYYLIGLRHPHRELFERIAWSTADVLADTLERAADISLPVELLPTWYDVDDAATLRLLCGELSLSSVGYDGQAQFRGGFEAPHTRKYLAGLIAADGPQRLIADVRTAQTRA